MYQCLQLSSHWSSKLSGASVNYEILALSQNVVKVWVYKESLFELLCNTDNYPLEFQTWDNSESC